MAPWPARASARGAAVERPTNSTRGRPRDRPHRPEEAVGDRQRHRRARPAGPRRRSPAISGSNATTRSKLAASTCASSHSRRSRSGWPPPTVRGIGSVRKPSDRRAQAVRTRPAGMISGRKTTTTCGRERVRARAQRRGVAAWRNSKKRVRRPAPPSSSAHASKNVACPTNARRSGRPAGGAGYGRPRAGEVDAHGRGYDSPLRCPTGRSASPARPARPARRARRCATGSPRRSSARRPRGADLGCGNGVAAADALGGGFGGRAVLVDVDEPSRERRGARARRRRRDVTARRRPHRRPPTSRASARALLAGDAGRASSPASRSSSTCRTFVPLVELLVELAERRATRRSLLSVPNDAFWAIENPYHETTWGEGAFEELRRLLPEGTVVARQVALHGSALVPLERRRRPRDHAPTSRCDARRRACRPTSSPPSGPRAGELARTPRSRRSTSTSSAAGSASARPTSRTSRPADVRTSAAPWFEEWRRTSTTSRAGSACRSRRHRRSCRAASRPAP